MSQKVEGRPPLRRKEKHQLEMLMAASSEISKGKDDIKERLYAADPSGNLWRNLTCALGLIRKVQKGIYSTVPLHQLEQFRTVCECGIVTMNVNAAILPKGYTAIADSDLNVICASAVNEICGVCVQDSRECSSCQLRKSLLTFWPPKEYNKYGRCPYQDVKWAKDSTETMPEEENN